MTRARRQLIDHEFVDAVDEESGLFRLDLRKLHLVCPVAGAAKPGGGA